MPRALTFTGHTGEAPDFNGQETLFQSVRLCVFTVYGHAKARDFSPFSLYFNNIVNVLSLNHQALDITHHQAKYQPKYDCDQENHNYHCFAAGLLGGRHSATIIASTLHTNNLLPG